MSISKLLEPNVYELYCSSINVSTTTPIGDADLTSKLYVDSEIAAISTDITPPLTLQGTSDRIYQLNLLNIDPESALQIGVDSTDNASIAGAGTNINDLEIINMDLIISNTTASTNELTGSLIVGGGCGISENLNIGGEINSGNLSCDSLTCDSLDDSITHTMTLGNWCVSSDVDIIIKRLGPIVFMYLASYTLTGNNTSGYVEATALPLPIIYRPTSNIQLRVDVGLNTDGNGLLEITSDGYINIYNRDTASDGSFAASTSIVSLFGTHAVNLSYMV